MNVMSGGMGTMRTLKKILTTLILGLFASGQILPSVPAWSGTVPGLPIVGPTALLSPAAVAHNPAQMVGMTLRPENPLQLEFLIDAGQAQPDDDAFGEESRRLIHYFMAALTVPEHDLWVNLSPYEKDRIMADGISRTEMGRDLLEQDYLLKQFTAALLIPDSATGEAFWERARAQWAATGSTEEMPTDLHSRVWIMPDAARVYLRDRTVLVTDARLKVMLEEDYLAAEVNQGRDNHGLGPAKDSLRPLNAEQTRLVREMILPQIQREVNEGATFVRLRQIYHAMVLAVWYKNNLQSSVLNHAYAGRNRVQGIDPVDPGEKDQLHARYLQAFQDGLYGMVKDEYDPARMEIVSRRYVSGGIDVVKLAPQTVDPSSEPNLSGRNIVTVDAAMATSPRVQEFVDRFRKSYKQQKANSTIHPLAWSAQEIAYYAYQDAWRAMGLSEVQDTLDHIFNFLIPDRVKFLKAKIKEFQKNEPGASLDEILVKTIKTYSAELGLTGKLLGVGDHHLTPAADFYDTYLKLVATHQPITIEMLSKGYVLYPGNKVLSEQKTQDVLNRLNRLLAPANLKQVQWIMSSRLAEELSQSATQDWFETLGGTLPNYEQQLNDFFNSRPPNRRDFVHYLDYLIIETDVSRQAWEFHLSSLLPPGETLESHYRKQRNQFEHSIRPPGPAPAQPTAPVPLQITHEGRIYKVLKIAEAKFDDTYFKFLKAEAEKKLENFFKLDKNERHAKHGQNVKEVFRIELGMKDDGRAYFRVFEDEGYIVVLDASATREGHDKKGNLKETYKTKKLTPYEYVKKEGGSFTAFLQRIQEQGKSLEPVFKSQAMLSQEVGGIDLNPAALNLSVWGDAQLLDQAFADAAADLDFDPNFIQGIYPVIQMMTPAPPVPLLLGQESGPADGTEDIASASPGASASRASYDPDTPTPDIARLEKW